MVSDKIKISDIANLDDQSLVEFCGIICDKKILQKKDNGFYLNISVQDNTGTINFPVWNDYETYNNKLLTSSVVMVRGSKTEYNGECQIKNPQFRLLPASQIPLSSLIPSYEIPNSLITNFERIVSELSTPYKEIAIKATGIDNKDSKQWKDFIQCVSAEKHHGNKLGGLFLHTYGVTMSVVDVCKRYVDSPYFYDASKAINKNRLILKAILHDIKKIDEYEWNPIIRRKPDKKIGHIIDGCCFIRKLDEDCGKILSEEDIDDIQYSILSHHGQWGPFQPNSLEDTLLHLADMVDSQIVGKIE